MDGVDDWYSNYAHRHELTPGFSSDDDIPDPFVIGEVPEREWTVPAGRSSSRSRNAERPAEGLRELPPANRGGSWQSAARKWLTEFPQGTNRECQRALRAAGHTGVSTKLIARLRDSMPKPTATGKPTGTAAGKPTATRGRKKTKSQPVNQKKSVVNNGRRSRFGGRRRRTEAPWHTFALDWLRRHPGASNRQWQEAIEEAGHLGVTAAGVSALRATVKPIRSRARSAMVTRTAQKVQLPASRARRCDACDLVVGDDGRCRC